MDHVSTTVPEWEFVSDETCYNSRQEDVEYSSDKRGRRPESGLVSVLQCISNTNLMGKVHVLMCHAVTLTKSLAICWGKQMSSSRPPSKTCSTIAHVHLAQEGL